MAQDQEPITGVDGFITVVERDYAAWRTVAFPWFRGEPGDDAIEPLLPKLYRKWDGRPKPHDENQLLQFFRMRAPILNLPVLPDVGRIDQWLFLARHVGLPTRLLDWTEGALVALYFALRSKARGKQPPVVWMLNPHALNMMSVPPGTDLRPNEPTLTWITEGNVPGTANLYAANIQGAWSRVYGQQGEIGVDLPVAIYPTNVHPRMSAQHSCFTVHGKNKRGLGEMVGPDCLRRYDVGNMDRAKALAQLRRLGVAEAGLYPDAEGLARELEMIF